MPGNVDNVNHLTIRNDMFISSKISIVELPNRLITVWDTEIKCSEAEEENLRLFKDEACNTAVMMSQCF